jgi:hypothetical protein
MPPRLVIKTLLLKEFLITLETQLTPLDKKPMYEENNRTHVFKPENWGLGRPESPVYPVTSYSIYWISG